MGITFTSPEQDLFAETVGNSEKSPGITFEDVDQQIVDQQIVDQQAVDQQIVDPESTEYQVAALTDTTATDAVPMPDVTLAEDQIVIDDPGVKPGPSTVNEFQIENSILDLIRYNYSERSPDAAADYLNFLVRGYRAEVLDEIVLPNRNGQYTYLTGPNTEFTDPEDFSPRARDVKNPFYGNPEKLNRAIRRSQMKVSDGGFPMLMQSPGAAPEGAEFIASEWGIERQHGELYFDLKKQQWKYHPTFGEQSLRDVEDIGKSVARGLVEMPNMAVALGYLANMGVSYGRYGVDHVTDVLFDFLGISPTDDDAEKRLRENLEKGHWLTVGSTEYAEFEKQYAELTEPIRDAIGYFGPSEDKDYIDRFLEELFVMGVPILGAGAVILKTGQSYGRNVVKSQVKSVEIGKKLGVPIRPNAMLRVQDDILGTLKGKVDDKVIEQIRLATPEKRISLMKEHGVSDDLIQNYNLAEEAMKLQRMTSSAKSRKALDKYAEKYTPLAPEQTVLSIRGEAMRLAQSEIAATAGFTAGMEAFPDNPWISMGMGLTGAWFGGSGAYYLANRGPLKSVQALRESKTIIPLTMDRLRVQKYSAFKAFAEFLPGAVTSAERQAYRVLGGKSGFPEGEMSRKDFYETLAADEVLKIFGKYDEFKNLSPARKMEEARKFAEDRKMLDHILKMESQAKDWSTNVPREELARMADFYQQQQKFIDKINAILPEGESVEAGLSELFNLPTLAFLEKNLLDNINASLSFRLEQVPMLSDYSYILIQKQKSLDALTGLLERIGDLGVDASGRPKLDASANKLVDDMRNYVDDAQDQLQISRDDLGDLIETKFKPHAKTIRSPRENDKIQDFDTIDAGTRVREMLDESVQNNYIAYQNRRLQDVLDVKIREIDDAYDAINFEHIIEDSSSIAGILERTILQIEETVDPTRSYVGARPSSTRKILETARWRAISEELAEIEARSGGDYGPKLAYINDLHEDIDIRLGFDSGLDMSKPNNRVASRDAMDTFHREIDKILENPDELSDAQINKIVTQKIEARLRALTKIDPDPNLRSGTGEGLLKAKYSIKEFAKLRSHFSAQSVYASKGADRYTYRELAEQLNDFMVKGQKSVTDADHLTALDNANRIYAKYMNLFGVGPAKKTMSKDEQARRNFGVRYVDDTFDEADPDNPGVIQIISENEFMNFYTAPFFKARARPDTLRQYAKQWKEIFGNPDGSFHQQDIDMLLQSFGYEAMIGRTSGKAVGTTERQAHEAFVQNFGDIITAYGGRNGETFLSLQDVYKRVKPGEYEQAATAQFQDIGKATLTLKQEQKSALALVNYVLTKNKNNLEGSVFAQLAGADIQNLAQLRKIIFGGGDTADIRFLRTPEAPEIGLSRTEEGVVLPSGTGIASEQAILPAPAGSYSPRGVEALGEAGVILDVAESKPAAQNFRQILEWARKEGTQTIDGVKVNVFEETRDALKRILIQDMTETVIAATNKKRIQVHPRAIEGNEGHSKLLESKVDSKKFADYLENNKAAFEELLGKEHTEVLEEIFKVTWTLGPDAAESTINGLFKGYTASNLQSLFWAVARNVVSVRFAAGMLGIQAYRRGTTKYFETLLKDKKAAVILDKAFRSKKPPTREEMSAFKNTVLFMFGPQVAARVTQDAFVEERARIQADMERASLSDEEMQEMIRPKPQDLAGKSDAMLRYQGLVDEAGNILADPVREFANQAKLIEYGDIIDEAMYRRSEQPSVGDDVDTQMSNLNLNQ